MAEKRAACKVAAQGLSGAIGFEIAASEVSGTRVTELDTLLNFYKRYEELLTSMGPTLSTRVSDGRTADLPIEEMQKVASRSQALKLLPSYVDMNNRIAALTTLVGYAKQWGDVGVSASTASYVSDGLCDNPTLSTLLQLLGKEPGKAEQLMEYATAEAEASALIADGKALCEQNAEVAMGNIRGLEKCVNAMRTIMTATSPVYDGGALKELEEACEVAKSARHIIEEVDTLNGYAGLGAILPSSASDCLQRAASAAKELVRCKHHTSLAAYASQFPQQTLSQTMSEIASVRTLLSSVCGDARGQLPLLSSLTDADIVQYCTIGSMDSADGQAFISNAFPWWRKVVLDGINAVAIQGSSGEILTLDTPIAVDDKLSAVLPGIVAEQRSTIMRHTIAAQDLAHEVAIGKQPFKPEAIVAMPSQVAVRFILLLWTELTEGAIAAAALASPAASGSLTGLSTPNGNAPLNLSTQPMRRIGRETRTPSRPQSASIGRQSRQSSPRKSVAEDPRPGSASSTLFRKTAKGDDKKTQLLATSDLFDAKLARPSTTSSARARIIPTPLDVPSIPAAGQHVPSKARPQSSIATHTRLAAIMSEHLSALQDHMASTILSEAQTCMLQSVIQWQHRLGAAWERQVSSAVSSDDYLWRREPRMYASADGRGRLELGDYTIALDHHFIPVDAHFILSDTDQMLWQHVLLMRAIGRSPMIVGAATSIDALVSICGRPASLVSCVDQLPRNPDANDRFVVIQSPEKLAAKDQEAVAQWLGDSNSGNSAIIICKSTANLHPFISTYVAPFLPPADDSSSRRAALERMLLAAGLADTDTITEQLMSFTLMSGDVGGWNIPNPLLHYALAKMTPAMKRGMSIDVALRRCIFGTLLARAPLHCVHSLKQLATSIFGFTKETMYYPQLTDAMDSVFADLGLVGSEELMMMCKTVVDFILGVSGDETVLVVRGEGRVGKHSVVKAALAVARAISKEGEPRVLVMGDLPVGYKAPEGTKIVSLTSADILPSEYLMNNAFAVMVVESAVPPAVLVGVKEAVATVEDLVAKFKAPILAMARAIAIRRCAGSTGCNGDNNNSEVDCNKERTSGTVSEHRTMATLLGLVGAVLRKVGGNSSKPEVVERAFWFAATCACAPCEDAAWLQFIEARMDGGIRPQNIFSVCLNGNGDWAPWEELYPMDNAALHCNATSRCLGLLHLHTLSGESVLLVGPQYIGAAVTECFAGGSKATGAMSFVVGNYTRHVGIGYAGTEQPPFPSVPVVIVPSVLSVSACEALPLPLGSLFTRLRGRNGDEAYASACTLEAFAAANDLVVRSDQTDATSRAIVAMIAKGRVPTHKHAALETFLGAPQQIVTCEDSKVGCADVAVAAEQGGYSMSETRLISVVAAMSSVTLPTVVAITATRGCAATVSDACSVAADMIKKQLVVVSEFGAVAAASSPSTIVRYEASTVPSSGDLEQLVPSLKGAVIIDLSRLVCASDVVATLQETIMVVEYAFTADDLRAMVQQKGETCKAFMGIIDALPATNTVDPQVFRTALGLFDRIRGAKISAGQSDSVTTRHSVRSFKNLENKLAKRPLVSTAERDYRGPNDASLMMLFEGTITYKEYPAEAVRFMMCPKVDDKGSLREYTHVSTCIGTPTGDVVCLTATEGGQCRARIEAGTGGIVIAAAPYELKLLPSPTDENGYEGAVMEAGRGSVQVGTIAVSRVEGDGSIAWLRGVESLEVLGDDSLGGSQSGPNEERERLNAAAAAALKTVARLGDQKLREAQGELTKADHMATAAAVLLLATGMDCQTRRAFVEQVQADYQQSIGVALPDPLSRNIVALVLGQSPAAVSLWLGSQRPELPNDEHGEQTAIAVRTLRGVGLEPRLYDPTGVFAKWAAKAEVQLTASPCEAAMVDGSHTLNTLAQALGEASAASSSTSKTPQSGNVDLTALTAAADQDQANREMVSALLTQAGALEGEALYEYLVTPEAQAMLGRVVVPNDTPSSPIVGAVSTGTSKGAAKKGVVEKETVSAPLRFAAITLACARLLPAIRPIYAMPTRDIMALAVLALQTPAKTGHSVADTAVKAFGQSILATVLQEDRLLLSAGMAMAVLVEEKRADPNAFGLCLQMLRNADPSGLEEEGQGLMEAAKVAFADWQRAQEATKARGKKEVRELKDFIDPKMMPSYPFMGPQQWANILCLAEAVPTLSGLPASMQHGDLGKGATKQDKWSEWLETCLGPLPNFEKGAVQSPLDQLLVILAIRPSKLVVGLLQFVVETLGADFPDPYSNEDGLVAIGQGAKASRRVVLLHSELAAPQAIQQSVVAAAKATGTAPPTVLIESALFPTRAAEAINTAIRGNSWVLIEDCESVSPDAVKEILAIQPPAEFTGTIMYSLAPPNAAASSGDLAGLLMGIPRVTCNFVWSLRRTMTNHYTSLQGSVTLHPNTHRLVFVTVFLLSALEQRSRFGSLGFSSPRSFAACERYVAAAVATVLKVTARGTGAGDIPWDSLREQLFMILCGVARTTRDRGIVQAYIDWLIHPQVVFSDAELGNGVALPTAPAYDNHLLVIAQLPDTTSTEMIGLNTGVELRQREQESERVFTFLEDAFVPPSSQYAVDTLVWRISHVLPSITSDKLAEMLESGAATSEYAAMPVVLANEWRSFLSHANAIRRDLVGIQAKSNEWRTAFVQQRVPTGWERPDEPHGSLQVFIGTLQAQYQQLLYWSTYGLPRVLSIAAVRDPRSFITGARFDAALMQGRLVSRVAAHFDVATEQSVALDGMSSPGPITEGFTFIALQMVGTVIDRKGMLQELFEQAIFWWQMPSTEVGGVKVTFGPADADGMLGRPKVRSAHPPTRPGTAFHRSTARTPVSPQKLQECRTSIIKRGVFAAPLYATASQRPEDLVGYVPIDCFEDNNYWVLRGAAIVGAI